MTTNANFTIKHKTGIENALTGVHHKNIIDDSELIQYYINVLRLFFGTPEAEAWMAQKLREDVPVLAKVTGMSRQKAILWWCNAHWKLISATHKEHYEPQEIWEDEFGPVESYIVWLEEK